MRRIIFNGKFYSGRPNGVHRVADNLVREVDRQIALLPPSRRPDVRLLLPKKRNWTPQLKIIRIEEEPAGDSQLWEQVVLPWRARGAVLINLCNLAPLLARRRILLLHDAQFLFPDSGYPLRRRLGHRLLSPTLMRGSAVPLTVSQYSTQIMDLTGICPRERIGVLYNGVDHILDEAPPPGVLEQWGLKERRFVLLFGSPKRYKNIEVVFEAFRAHALSDTTLAVVGSSKAELAAAGIKAPVNAVFLGPIDDAVLRGLYEKAICLAMPSRTEGFGLPPVEAMLLGCPTLVAPAGAMPEICRDAACYADIDDASEWVSAIRLLRDDSAFRRQKIASGRKRAGEFTWARAGSKLLDLALSLAGEAVAPDISTAASTEQAMGDLLAHRARMSAISQRRDA